MKNRQIQKPAKPKAKDYDSELIEAEIEIDADPVAFSYKTALLGSKADADKSNTTPFKRTPPQSIPRTTQSLFSGGRPAKRKGSGLELNSPLDSTKKAIQRPRTPTNSPTTQDLGDPKESQYSLFTGPASPFFNIPISAPSNSKRSNTPKTLFMNTKGTSQGNTPATPSLMNNIFLQ